MRSPDAEVASALVRLSGMSLAEVAEHLGISVETYRSYQSGRLKWPEHRLEELRQVCVAIYSRACTITEVIEERTGEMGPPGVIEIALPSSDTEARHDGLPAVGCVRAVAAMVATMHPEVDVRLVPRDSTPGTRAAQSARTGRPRP